jgi:hypothetical protein
MVACWIAAFHEGAHHAAVGNIGGGGGSYLAGGSVRAG